MLAKRIIPCLDVKDGRVVKGVNFTNLIDAGDPAKLAEFYNNQGADELVFLDIAASNENKKTITDVVREVGRRIFIPLTVGGGIKTISDMKKILLAGADKISINTAAIKNPKIISEAARALGSQCIVLAIDAKKQNGKWEVFVNGGRTPTKLDAIKWAQEGVNLGAGEILLTSMDRDGTKKGYDLELTSNISESVIVPVIASGGAGTLKCFSDVLTKGKADAVLAASLFHFGKFKIKEVKDYLKSKNISVRD